MQPPPPQRAIDPIRQRNAPMAREVSTDDTSHRCCPHPFSCRHCRHHSPLSAFAVAVIIVVSLVDCCIVVLMMMMMMMMMMVLLSSSSSSPLARCCDADDAYPTATASLSLSIFFDCCFAIPPSFMPPSQSAVNCRCCCPCHCDTNQFILLWMIVVVSQLRTLPIAASSCHSSSNPTARPFMPTALYFVVK